MGDLEGNAYGVCSVPGKKELTKPENQNSKSEGNPKSEKGKDE